MQPSDPSTSLTRIRQPDALGPLHVVMIALVGATVGGACLLLSAAESDRLIDGAIAWHEESPLRAVVQLLCLQYEFATIHAGAVKNYIFGIGTGLALAALGIATWAGGRLGRDEDRAGHAPLVPSTPIEKLRHSDHLVPLLAAQLTALLYLLWSFTSSRWSAAPELAVGASILLSTCFLWSLCLGCGLGPAAARVCTRLIVVITACTAGIAIWYYYARNPVLRAKFPFGNPIFLATCLIPGMLLSVCLILESAMAIVRGKQRRSVGTLIVGVLALAIASWAFALAGSRGPTVGLAFGLLTILFCVVRRWWKLLPVTVAVALCAIGSVKLVEAAHAPANYGRSASLRTRLHAWRYAWDLSSNHPIQGLGQGGFVLLGDALAANDVENDPLALKNRIAHAHNEWLEVLCDLGIVGLGLAVSVLVLTIRAGMLALRARPAPHHRWPLIGVLGALVALIVEESFGVGLRVSGVPVLFYTVIGLAWAFASSRTMTARFATNRPRRIGALVIGCSFGLAVIAASHQEFVAAREAYEASRLLAERKYPEAVARASAATNRLNPQRSLTAYAQLANTHMLYARFLQQRAIDREQRASQNDPVAAAPLWASAAQDRQASEQHCAEGSAALKRLVEWSPGFLNHGRIESWLNVIKAQNAEGRNDADGQSLALEAAAAAIGRELRRQPYDPDIAIDYIRLAVGDLELARLVEVLGRPLRHHRITARFVETLIGVARQRDLTTYFRELLARVESQDDGQPDSGASPHDRWLPERLRLAAALFFQMDEFGTARAALERAAHLYDPLRKTAPLGTTSCFSELAVCRFYDDPQHPGAALEATELALSLAPESLEGRRLKDSIRQRMVGFRLAVGDEDGARSLLRASAPRGFTPQMLLTELGGQYRLLCESMLALPGTYSKTRAALDRWAARARDLAGDDPLVHLVSADLSRRAGECGSATQHLRRALQQGLEPNWALEFLGPPSELAAECDSLEKIRDELLGTRPPRPPTATPSVGKTAPADPPQTQERIPTETQRSPNDPS